MIAEDRASAAAAYDTLAPAYDLLTSGYAYDSWLANLEALAREHGLAGSRVLDVACGTGRSFAPLLDRGYEIAACDGSPGMAAIAAARAQGRAAVHVADMRALPCYGAFDLVLCLDDAINHLLHERDVVDALSGMRGNLAPHGLLLFDVNTALAYEGHGDFVRDGDGLFVAARGSGPLRRPGSVVELGVDVFTERPHGAWERRTATWRHRHYPVAVIRRLVQRAGLRLCALRGQRRGGVIEADLDERVHRKVVVVARPGREP